MLYPVELWLHLPTSTKSHASRSRRSPPWYGQRTGGESGIRTRDTSCPVCRFSKPVPSATRPPLQTTQQALSSLVPSAIRLSVSRVEEEEGFEPPVLSHNGFQDRRLKPLGHSSKRRSE